MTNHACLCLSHCPKEMEVSWEKRMNSGLKDCEAKFLDDTKAWERRLKEVDAEWRSKVAEVDKAWGESGLSCLPMAMV